MLVSPFKILLLASSLPFCLYGATQTVTSTADTATSGTLRYAILNSASGDTIDCSGIAGDTITLTNPLPAILQSSLTITVATGNPVTIDGTTGNHFQAFSIVNGNVNISKFNVINAGSQGGAGGSSGGGGGGGVGGGGGLYVHNGANTTIGTLVFTNNEAVGGAGGTGSGGTGSGGGGGGFGNNAAGLTTTVNAGGSQSATGGGGGGGGNTGGGNGGAAAAGVNALATFFAGAGGGAATFSGGGTTPFGMTAQTGGSSVSNNGGGGAGVGGAGGNGTGSAGGVGGNGIGVDLFFGGGGGGGGSSAGGSGGAGFGAGGGGGGATGGAGGANGGGGGGAGGTGTQGGKGGFGGGGGGGIITGGSTIFGGGSGGTSTSAGGGGGAALGGAIFIQNGGTLTITDGCNFSGNTVTAGTSGTGGTTAMALSEDIFLRSGGTLNFSLFTSSLTIASSIDSDQGAGGGTGGGVTLSGSQTLTFSEANTYSGTTTIQGGTLNVGAGDSSLGASANSVVIGTGTLQAGAALNSSRAFSLTGSATIDTKSFNSSLSGTISGSGSLTKVGTASLTLAAGNTYSSGTTISAGTLIIGSDSALGSSSGPLSIGAATLQTTGAVSSARTVSLTGGATINVGAFTDTLAGPVSGTGSLTLAGTTGGVLVLSGTNSYTGGTTVNPNLTLQGNSSSLQGNIQDNGSVVFAQTSSGTYSGVLTGAGSLSQTGSGTLIVSGSSPAFSGSTSVTNGVLSVTGSLSGSPVTVGASGTLSGTGTVGAVTDSGQIIPGSGTSGTLSVNGTLSLSGTSTTTINVSPTSNTALSVSGAASLNGALSVVPASGFYGVSVSYTILTTPTLTGTFSSVASSNSNFVPTISYNTTSSPNTVVLSGQIIQPFLGFAYSNPNTQSVGNNINALGAANEIDPALQAILNSLAGQSTATLNAALDQMHPAQFGAFTEVQMALGGQLISLFHRKPYLPGSCDSCSNPYRIWAEPFGNNLEETQRGFEIGFTSNSGGIAFGIDAQFRDNWTFGIGGAWNDTHIDWHHSRGHATINGYYGAAYTDVQKENVYLGLSVYAGYDFYDATRHIEFVTTNLNAKSNFSALDIVGQFSTAYFFGNPLAHIYPYATVDLMYLKTKGFSESGASGLNLDIGSVRNSTVRAEAGVGLQVQDLNADETISISPLLNFGWVMFYPLDRNRYTSTFEGEPIPFSVIGRRNDWQLISLDFGLSFSYKCFTMALEYNVLSSVNPHKGGFFDQNGSVHLQWKW